MGGEGVMAEAVVRSRVGEREWWSLWRHWAQRFSLRRGGIVSYFRYYSSLDELSRYDILCALAPNGFVQSIEHN